MTLYELLEKMSMEDELYIKVVDQYGKTILSFISEDYDENVVKFVWTGFLWFKKRIRSIREYDFNKDRYIDIGNYKVKKIHIDVCETPNVCKTTITVERRG